MWRNISALLAIALLSVVASAQDGSSAREAALQASVPTDIRGVWEITELASRVAGAAWEVRAKPYRSLYIFSENHYSYMYVPGPRKLFVGDPNRPTDAEKAEAYNSLVAATGVYSLSGKVLTLKALVHKNPNEMAGATLAYEVEVDSNTLRMVVADPPFLPGGEWRTILRRIE